MTEPVPTPPRLTGLVRKLVSTGAAALHNRGELFAVELQEERNRLIELFIWAVAACFMGMMFMLVLTATVIFMFPEDLRLCAAGGFCLLYLIGAILALLNLRSLIRNTPPPFADSLAEIKKDFQCLDSLK